MRTGHTNSHRGRAPVAEVGGVTVDVVTDAESGGSRDRSLIGGLVGRVAPAVMRQIDTNDIVDALDINVIAEELDLDALVARLDLDALVERLDINAIAARLDMDVLVDRLDVNMIAARLDMDVLVDRLDVNMIAARLDMDVLVDRLDVNAIAARLDMDALVDRIDINAVAGELDMAKITAGATQDVAASGLDLVRRQIMRMDATVDGFSDRVLRRRSETRPVAPPELAARDDVVALEEDPHELHRKEVSGHYAGPVTRGLSIIGDLLGVIGVQALLGWLVYVVFGVVFDTETPGWGRWLALAVLGSVFLAWFWIPVALFGRTIGMALLGVAVVRRDGGIVDGRRAFVRAFFFPVSVILPFCLIGLVVGKERRALHDVIAGTTVLYDWGAREAEQPVTIRQQLTARVRRRTESQGPPESPDPA
jgi:uncharacterized RDD family membrane protein YckC